MNTVVYVERASSGDVEGEDVCDPTAATTWHAQPDGSIVCWLGDAHGTSVRVRPSNGQRVDLEERQHAKRGAVYGASWTVYTESPAPGTYDAFSHGCSHVYGETRAEVGEDKAPITDPVSEAMAMGLEHARIVARRLEVGLASDEHHVVPWEDPGLPIAMPKQREPVRKPVPLKTYVVVACGKEKAKAAQRHAIDLYQGPIFKLRREWAETLHDGVDWILSALHGLLDPDEPGVEPYDKTMADMTKAEREAWGDEVGQALLSHTEPGDTVIVLAGKDYAVGWPGILTAAERCVVHRRFKGIGYERQALGQEIAAESGADIQAQEAGQLQLLAGD
jgi:hypothetical protein